MQLRNKSQLAIRQAACQGASFVWDPEVPPLLTLGLLLISDELSPMLFSATCTRGVYDIATVKATSIAAVLKSSTAESRIKNDQAGEFTASARGRWQLADVMAVPRATEAVPIRPLAGC